MEQALTGFTNVQRLDPDILVDLRYATTDNFTHQVIYDFTTAIVRTGTAHKLAQASAIVKQEGYRLKIWMPTAPLVRKNVCLKSTLTPNSLRAQIRILAIKKASRSI